MIAYALLILPVWHFLLLAVVVSSDVAVGVRKNNTHREKAFSVTSFSRIGSVYQTVYANSDGSPDSICSAAYLCNNWIPTLNYYSNSGCMGTLTSTISYLTSCNQGDVNIGDDYWEYIPPIIHPPPTISTNHYPTSNAVGTSSMVFFQTHAPTMKPAGNPTFYPTASVWEQVSDGIDVATYGSTPLNAYAFKATNGTVMTGVFFKAVIHLQASNTSLARRRRLGDNTGAASQTIAAAYTATTTTIYCQAQLYSELSNLAVSGSFLTVNANNVGTSDMSGCTVPMSAIVGVLVAMGLVLLVLVQILCVSCSPSTQNTRYTNINTYANPTTGPTSNTSKGGSDTHAIPSIGIVAVLRPSLYKKFLYSSLYAYILISSMTRVDSFLYPTSNMFPLSWRGRKEGGMQLPIHIKKIDNDAGSSTDKLGPSEWIRDVFGKMSPQKHYLHRQSGDLDGAGCIINAPHNTMAIPLLQVNITEIVGSVMIVASMESDYRSKPVLVTVRGVGGGKTRLYEEIRRSLICDETVLPIAISFNSRTEMRNVEYREPGGDDDAADRSAALSIISRMATSFYGFSVMDDKIIKLNRSRLQEDFNVVSLYEAFIQLMRDQLQGGAGQSINKVVLMVDETMNLLDVLAAYYPRTKDPLKPLRTAIMDNTPGGVLALTSLETALQGFTDSGRPMRELRLPEALDTSLIVAQWWKITDSALIFRFSLIAAMLCDLPRALEVAGIFIEKHRSELHHTDIAEKLMKHVLFILKERYPIAGSQLIPSPQLLYAMWFRGSFTLNKEAQRRIRSSILTNVLDPSEIRAASAECESVSFVPRANIFLLSLCKVVQGDQFGANFLTLVHNYISTSTVPQPHAQEGDLLEQHTALALAARVGVAMNAGKTITVAQLLGLSVNVVPGLNCKIRFKPQMADTWTSEIPRLRYRSNSPDELAAFLEELESIHVSAEAPIAVRRGAPWDGFDFLLKVFDSSVPGRCRYIAIDCKSKRVTPKNDDAPLRNASNPESFPTKGIQAVNFCDAMQTAGAQVTYVYLTNHAQVQCAHAYQSKEPEKHRHGVYWVYAGRQELKQFMGPMWDLHRTFREGYRVDGEQ